MTHPGAAPGTPGAPRVRWPAEWEPHAATWLSWPHNSETWPGRLEPVEALFAQIVGALQPHERVCINVKEEAHEAGVRARLERAGLDADANLQFHWIPTDDAWVRDHGAIFVWEGDAELTAVDFRFDAWGGKYPPFNRDAAAARGMAGVLGIPCRTRDRVLEGGSIDGDGCGTILTTESCLLHPNRGRGRTRELLEALLAESLGARKVLWLGAGIVGDDTDGHVDDVARFVGPATVVAAREENSSDPNFASLDENLRRLRSMANADGKPLDVVTVPMPRPLGPPGGRLPASYANFYLGNGVALVPTYGVPEDARALAVLRELLHDREVLGLDCRDLIVGLGALHCVTQQQPAPA